MDILKKLFEMNEGNRDADIRNEKAASIFNEFRKPIWFDDEETDDELFDENRAFQQNIFKNQNEMHKYFQEQITKALKEFDENNTFERPESAAPSSIGELIDTDLDEEVLSNQLQNLFERIQPESNTIMPSTSTSKSILGKEKKAKRTDEEKFMDYIHGINLAEVQTEQPRKSIPKKKSAGAIKRFDVPNNIFDSSAFRSSPAITGPETKIFRQSVITQTIRKPDGSYETRKVVCDIDGNTKTTLTRTQNGKTETITSFNDQLNDGKITTEIKDKTNKIIEFDKIGTDDSTDVKNNSIKCQSHVFVSKDGYALPKNLW